jgi:hypothetical protein
LSLFLRRAEKPLDRTQGGETSLASTLGLPLFCPLLFYAPSTPNLVYPQNAQPQKRPAKEKKKKAQKTIEGYINSYIQKSKKEAKARRNKKQNGERG